VLCGLLSRIKTRQKEKRKRKRKRKEHKSVAGSMGGGPWFNHCTSSFFQSLVWGSCFDLTTEMKTWYQFSFPSFPLFFPLLSSSSLLFSLVVPPFAIASSEALIYSVKNGACEIRGAWDPAGFISVGPPTVLSCLLPLSNQVCLSSLAPSFKRRREFNGGLLSAISA